MGLPFLGELAEVVATAGEQKDDPDPVTSVAKAIAASITTAIVTAAKAIATEAENQDDPDDIASAAATTSVTITSTVCCS